MANPILVTGAAGRIGRTVTELLLKQGKAVLAMVRKEDEHAQGLRDMGANVAAVAKHHGVKAFINMSQMTLAQMSITETTASPQHKLHWLAEQALNWSGLPVVHVRPTVMLEGFFLILTPDSVRESNQITLPFGNGKTSPVAVGDVARVIAALLANPEPHIGKIYHLTGPQSQNMHFYAQEHSKALVRKRIAERSC